MISHATEKFWKCFERLPKEIHHEKSIYSVRVRISHRAIGVRQGNTMIWFWIGSHETYNNLVSQL